MSRRLSQEEFEAEIFSRYGDEYVIKSKYLGSKEPIEIFHKECKNTFTCNNSNNFKLGNLSLRFILLVPSLKLNQV